MHVCTCVCGWFDIYIQQKYTHKHIYMYIFILPCHHHPFPMPPCPTGNSNAIPASARQCQKKFWLLCILDPPQIFVNITFQLLTIWACVNLNSLFFLCMVNCAQTGKPHSQYVSSSFLVDNYAVSQHFICCQLLIMWPKLLCLSAFCFSVNKHNVVISCIT